MKDNTGSIFYGLGLIGAVWYFLQGTTTFVEVLIAAVKSVFWPAVIVFELLKFFHA